MTVTFTDTILASFIGQLLLVAAVAAGYLAVALWRFLQEWRSDMAELRRSKEIARLRHRIDCLQAPR